MKYRFSDEVSMRLIQIFQEAILLGLDGADLLRQVRLVLSQDSNEAGTLELDPSYVESVEKFHDDLLVEINKKMEEASKSVDPKILT